MKYNIRYTSEYISKLQIHQHCGIWECLIPLIEFHLITLVQTILKPTTPRNQVKGHRQHMRRGKISFVKGTPVQGMKSFPGLASWAWIWPQQWPLSPGILVTSWTSFSSWYEPPQRAMKSRTRENLTVCTINQYSIKRAYHPHKCLIMAGSIAWMGF